MKKEKKEASTRIQTSILNGVEKKALIYLANRQPKWMTSNILTVIGMMGPIIISLGYILSQINLNYLWVSSLGFVINWYGGGFTRRHISQSKKQTTPCIWLLS